jgi:S-formylglutathione hydrolase
VYLYCASLHVRHQANGITRTTKMSPKLEKVSSNAVSTGHLTKYTFPSSSLGGLSTNVNVFIPKTASPAAPVPVLFYLAGLTCTEDTGCQKGGFLKAAGEAGIAVVCPDTSPRGAGVEGEDDDWQLGTGTWLVLALALAFWCCPASLFAILSACQIA